VGVYKQIGGASNKDGGKLMEIIPAILTKDVVEAQVLMSELVRTKKVTRVQVDFIDGQFANNQTFKPSELDISQYYPIKFDAHFMVVEDNILIWSKVAEKVGYERIITQVESISNPEEYGGLALDIHSPTTAIKPEWYPNLDVVLLMAVEPGFGSQNFVLSVVDKAREMMRIREECGYKFKIMVDGGVHKQNLVKLEEVGVDEVVVGGRRFLEEFV
jgi:pentose-5-phosphate-3-epimerase